MMDMTVRVVVKEMWITSLSVPCYLLLTIMLMLF